MDLKLHSPSALPVCFLFPDCGSMKAVFSLSLRIAHIVKPFIVMARWEKTLSPACARSIAGQVLAKMATAQERMARGSSWSRLPPHRHACFLELLFSKISPLESVQPTSRRTHVQRSHPELSILPQPHLHLLVLLQYPVMNLWRGDWMVRKPGGLAGWWEIYRSEDTVPPACCLPPPSAPWNLSGQKYPFSFPALFPSCLAWIVGASATIVC